LIEQIWLWKRNLCGSSKRFGGQKAHGGSNETSSCLVEKVEDKQLDTGQPLPIFAFKEVISRFEKFSSNMKLNSNSS